MVAEYFEVLECYIVIPTWPIIFLKHFGSCFGTDFLSISSGSTSCPCSEIVFYLRNCQKSYKIKPEFLYILSSFPLDDTEWSFLLPRPTTPQINMLNE